MVNAITISINKIKIRPILFHNPTYQTVQICTVTISIFEAAVFFNWIINRTGSLKSIKITNSPEIKHYKEYHGLGEKKKIRSISAMTPDLNALT